RAAPARGGHGPGHQGDRQAARRGCAAADRPARPPRGGFGRSGRRPMTTTSPITSATSSAEPSTAATALPRALPTAIQHYIDGSRVDSVAGTTIPVTDPVSHREYAVLAAGAAADVDLAVTAAQRAFEESGWAQMPSRRRSDVLRKIADAIESRAAVISAFEAFDTGQPVSQARGLATRAAENF